MVTAREIERDEIERQKIWHTLGPGILLQEIYYKEIIMARCKIKTDTEKKREKIWHTLISRNFTSRNLL